MRDVIHISELALQAQLGVPDEERASQQRLSLSMTLYPVRPFAGLNDCIENTVDYAKVCLAVQALVAQRPRKLLETLAEEIAGEILGRFAGCDAVDVELRKYALSDTAYVAVLLSRRRL